MDQTLDRSAYLPHRKSRSSARTSPVVSAGSGVSPRHRRFAPQPEIRARPRPRAIPRRTSRSHRILSVESGRAYPPESLDGERSDDEGRAPRAGRRPPAPETGRLALEERDEFFALAVGETADRLGRRILHCLRIRFVLTRPYLGTASSMSKTLAVNRYSGGASRTSVIVVRPALRSRFSWALAVRMLFARLRASIRWSRDRSGASGGLDTVFEVGAMEGREYSHPGATCRPEKAETARNRANPPQPQLKVYGWLQPVTRDE